VCVGSVRSDSSSRSVAIFPWGDVIEDFLDPIGLDVRAFAEEMTGGWLFGYVAALREAGWRSVIVCASRAVGRPVGLTHRGTGALIWLVPGRSVTADRSRSLHSLHRWASFPLRAFRQILINQDCSAIIAQEYEDPRFDGLILLGGSLGIPVIGTFQGGDRTLSSLEALVRTRTIKASAALIIAAKTERDRVTAHYGRNRLVLADIPNPIDCVEWQAMPREEARQRLGLQPDEFIAINHGRIDIARKGLDALIAAWRSCEHARLILIGSGQDDAAFKDLLARSRLESVRWIRGYSTDREFIRTWLSAADLYVSASRLEGMPVAPLEAMACGLPVVASDAQGLPEILADRELSGGILVRGDDPAGLSAAVNRLQCDDSLRRKLAKAARRRVQTHFSIPAVSQALGELLDRSLGPGSPQRSMDTLSSHPSPMVPPRA
jgi:glycosyltransferase involved in cell wall biosynthesis